MDLVIMKDQQAVTTSLQVAAVFGKEHRHVLEAIDKLKEGVAEKSAGLFHEDLYTHPQNKQMYRQIIMTRDGFTLLAMGFTGKQALQFKLKYIEAFNQMEECIKSQTIAIPSTPRELAKLALEANEETNQRIDSLETDFKEFQANKLITTEDKGTIDSYVRKKVYLICREQHLDQEAKSMLFQDLGSSIKRLFNVPNRGRIKDKDFERVLEFINSWEPSSVTKEQIRQLKLDV